MNIYSVKILRFIGTVPKLRFENNVIFPGLELRKKIYAYKRAAICVTFCQRSARRMSGWILILAHWFVVPRESHTLSNLSN